MPELKRETATYAKTLAASVKEWSTEARDASKMIWDEGVVKEESLQESKRSLRERAVAAYNRRLFVRARDKLHQLAAHRFGSLKQMFDNHSPGDHRSDGDSPTTRMITLEEFSTLLKRQKLENVFPRDHQRVIFEALDRSCEDRLQVDELVEFLDSENDDPFRSNPINTVPLPETESDTQEDLGFEKREVIVDKPLFTNDDAMRTKDDLVTALYQKTRKDKQHSAQVEGAVTQKQYLLNAFKQKDTAMDGWLPPHSVVDTLGEGHLNLEIEEDRLFDLVNAMRKDDQGRVNYASFIRFLELTDIEPDYNPFFDHRNRDLLNLKRLSEAPWTWPEHDIDPSHKNLEPPKGKGPKNLKNVKKKGRHRVARADDDSDDDDEKEGVYFKPLYTSTQLLHYNRVLAKTRADVVKGTSRPATSSGDLFADLRATKDAQLSSICPRFVPPPPTDWSRTGLGGDGINSRSGLYLDPAHRFDTTSQRYFAPLTADPNTRHLRRLRPSDADDAVARRNDKFRARKARNDLNAKAILEQRTKLQERALMNDEQRLKMKVRLFFFYF